MRNKTTFSVNSKGLKISYNYTFSNFQKYSLKFKENK